jgi:Flp pilus assembly protein CpaB
MPKTFPSVLLLLCLAVTAVHAEERLGVVVAARPLPAGTVLTLEMLAQRSIPAALVTSSHVKPDNSSYVVRQRLLEPLGAGEPLQWSQLAISAAAFVKPYCKALKEAEAGRRDYPEVVPQGQAVHTVLVAVKNLPSDTVLKRAMLVARVVPAEYVSPFVAHKSGAESVVGQRLLVPLQAGDMLRYPQLAGYASEPRCDWLFEVGGNLYEQEGPAEARALPCPAGTKPVAGIPGGAKWNPLRMPGWMVLCQKRDGTRHGPVRAWHRLGKGLLLEGQYEAGQRIGRWRSWDNESVTPEVEAHYVGGRLHGSFRHWDQEGKVLAEGRFQDGLREGPWTFSDTGEDSTLRLSFSAGLLHGSVRRLRADGAVERELVFERGVPQGGPHPEGTRVLVAARTLPAGTRIPLEGMASGPLPEPLVKPAFIQEDLHPYISEQGPTQALPKGAPLLWWDFQTQLLQELPAPAPPRGR